VANWVPVMLAEMASWLSSGKALLAKVVATPAPT
jgi:hypothetical protein